ncbi:MAG: U32 family peptidase [Clostridia bacterium]|nr:U32 family peptidase [Clostridia bacterium]
MSLPTPELLAPAGSPDALEAAIEAGADAVYFGGVRFSCRNRAKNFSSDEILSAIRLCRKSHVRSYVTLNARLYGRELPEALRFAEEVYLAGCDALIVSDLGFSEAVRQRCPGISLHASTQLSCASARDASLLRDLGFSRMVIPREFSMDRIHEICNASPLDIEMFVHGAHCVSFSGQCMMSYAMGGRSGNRGECAQPCRLPYSLLPGDRPGYPLSLKDMSLSGHVPEILSLGVSSLKIEGRQKNADYVGLVTSVWRRLLDEKRNATEEETNILLSAFNRQGFTDGYFVRRYRNMGGVREDAPSPEVPFVPEETRKVPLSLSFRAERDEKCLLTVRDGKEENTVFGPVPTEALNHPIDETFVRECLTKFGNTPYRAASFEAVVGEGLWLTRGQLNELRRQALEGLGKAPERTVCQDAPLPVMPAAPIEKRRAVGEFLRRDQIPEDASAFLSEIRLPLGIAEGSEIPVLPAVLTDDEEKEAVRLLRAFPEGHRAVVHSLGQLDLVRSLRLTPVPSFRFTVMNPSAAAVLHRLTGETIELSPELSLSDVSRFPGRKAFHVYGRLPLMYTFRCVLSSGGEKCLKKASGGDEPLSRPSSCSGFLKDRTGALFPLISDRCRTAVYNSVPTYMGDRPEELDRLGLAEGIFRFTDESAEEVSEILRSYRDHRPPKGNVKRIK